MRVRVNKVPSTHRAELKGECNRVNGRMPSWPPSLRKRVLHGTRKLLEGTHTHTQQCTSPGGAVFTLTWGWSLISKNKEKLIWPGDLSNASPGQHPVIPTPPSPPWPFNTDASSGDRKLGTPSDTHEHTDTLS